MPSSSTLAAPSGILVDRQCDVTLDVAARCYWLDVPERRDVVTGRLIRLWVAVLQPPGMPADAVPWLVLSGGPGNPASTSWVSGTATLRPNPTPIVIVDQRGTGRSEPRLDCPNPRLIDEVLGSWSERLVALRDAAMRCKRDLEASGIDLDGFDTTESAADLADLRAALGIDQWDVYGMSYGGRLALELSRQDPAGIRSMHLDSPMSLTDYGAAELITDAEAQIGRLSAACGQGSCGAVGQLDARLSAAYDRLEVAPHEVTLADGTTLDFDGGLMLSAVRLTLNSTATIPSVPSAVDAILAGNNAFLDGMAGLMAGPPPADPRDAVALGTFAAVVCADDGPGDESDAAAIRSPGRWSSSIAVWPWHSCDIWDVQPSSGTELTAVDNAIPTLLTVGELDIAAFRTVTDIEASSTNLQVVELPGGGHVIARANDCLLSISESFRTTPTAPLDTTCLAGLTQVFPP